METKLVMLCIILCSGYAITHAMDHKNKLGSQTNSSTQRKRSAAQISSEKESQRSENQLINHIVPSVALDSELPEEAHPNPKKKRDWFATGATPEACKNCTLCDRI